MYDLIKNVGQMPPCDQFRLGHQNDGSGHYYCVVVDTAYGRIPGKGKQGEAWYSFEGKEHSSRNFHFLKVHHGKYVTLEKSRFPPSGALATGYQKDSGSYYSVVCHHTGHGKVPGKSDGKNGWYSWGGIEHMTSDFSYVVVRVSGHGGHHHGGFTPAPAPYHPGGGFIPPSVPAYVPGFNPSYGGGFQPPTAGYAQQYRPPGYPAPPPQGLAQGMSVRFICKSGQHLRLKGCGEVDGHGGNGKFATFTVHVMGQGRYSFQNQNGQWLAIKFGNITHSAMYGDGDSIFLVHLSPDNSISLESSTMPGTFLGINKVGRSKLTGHGKPSTKLHLMIV